MKPKKKSLFAINQEQLSILYEIEQMEGELTTEAEKRLTITKNDLEHKSIAYREVILKREAENILIDKEIKRLQAMKKRNQNIINSLKDTLLTAISIFGIFKVGLVNFGFRKSQSIEIDDRNLIPDEFKTTTTTENINKSDLKKAIKEGREINGVRLINNKNLKIS